MTNLNENILKYKLETSNVHVIGKSVNIIFTLENLTNSTLYVLTWYTPLEGIKGKIFSVKRDGKDIIYEGRMFKRGNPNVNDYVRLEPKGYVTNVVDLSEAYDLSIEGKYTVEFRGRVFDVTDRKSTLPRKQSEHHSLDLTGNRVSFIMVSP